MKTKPTTQLPASPPLSSSDLLADFKRERNEAMLSLDAAKIRAMVRKWNGTEMPADPLTFWGAVHKAITGCLDLPIESRRKSKVWLDGHGLKSFDDGDLSANTEVSSGTKTP